MKKRNPLKMVRVFDPGSCAPRTPGGSTIGCPTSRGEMKRYVKKHADAWVDQIKLKFQGDRTGQYRRLSFRSHWRDIRVENMNVPTLVVVVRVPR
jgi:hypothetical protein